jgi:hypothetical protein
MPKLIELRLEISRTGGGKYAITATLLEQDPYPPRLVPEYLRDVRPTTTERSLGKATGRIGSDALVRVPTFSRSPLFFYFDAPPWQGLSAMPRDIQQLIWDFYRGAYRDLQATHRLVVHSMHPEVLEFPWQAFLPEKEDFHGNRIAFLARYPERPPNVSPFHLPLTLHIDGGLPAGRELFELFTLDAIAARTFEVRDTRETEPVGELFHFVNQVPAQLPPLGAMSYWPRLVVVHLDTESPAARDAPGTVSRLLEQGAGAVLLVSGPRERCQTFFQAFYRKVLHNLPLEECVREVLLQTHLRLGTDLDVLLGVREDGEYGLLASQGVVELANRLASATPGSLEPMPASLTSLRAPRLLQIANTLDPALQHLRSSAQLSVQESHAALESVAHRPFDSEMYDLRTAVTQFRDLERAHRGSRTLEQLEARNDEEFQGKLTRLLNVWLGQPPLGERLGPARPLRAGSSLSLHVKITSAPLFETFSSVFPEEVLREAFKKTEQVDLDVCVFHDGKIARVPQPRGTLSLPQRGPSTEFTTALHLENPGVCRLRVGVYHRNTLLQSVVIEAQVLALDATAPAPEGEPPIRFALDYVASPDLLLLDEHARPALNLVTNRAADGNLWIGVFSDRNAGQGGLRTGSLHTFPPEQLVTQLQLLRDALQQAHGSVTYKYAAPLDASNREERARQLTQLAIQGWRLYDTLFNSNPSFTDEAKESFDEGLEAPGTISIARCALEEASIPWAALYDRPLDANGSTRPAVCPVFLAQLTEGKALLDEPAQCRAQATCPLQVDPRRRDTVCPFGFWGIRHQLEQPLKQLKAEQAAELLTNPAFSEPSRLPAAGEPPPAVMGYGNNLPGITEHASELLQISGWKLQSSADRDTVMRALEQGPANLFYLFCHGVIQDKVFKLQFPPYSIEASNLMPVKGRSPFLVFINACESMATLPEVINQLLGKFTRMGAMAVIGSEIKVNNLFARPFARQVLSDFLGGHSLGESFLRARRHFLRDLNPSGLAYTLHSPVNVHLHGRTCPRCGPPPG